MARYELDLMCVVVVVFVHLFSYSFSVAGGVFPFEELTFSSNLLSRKQQWEMSGDLSFLKLDLN